MGDLSHPQSKDLTPLYCYIIVHPPPLLSSIANALCPTEQRPEQMNVYFGLRTERAKRLDFPIFLDVF